MARRNWTGAVDGNLANSSNYDTFPVSGDSLAFSGGYLGITAGTSALSGMLLSAVIVNEGFKGPQIGTAGSPVKLRTALLKVATNTAGLISVVGETTFTAVKVEKLAGSAPGQSLGLFVGAGTPTISKVELGAGPGYVEVASDVKVSAFRTGGMSGKLGPVASSPPDMVMRIGRGAIVESQRKVARAFVEGTLKVTETGSIAHSTSASTECVIGDGGRLSFSASGAFQRVERLPGSTLDFDGAKADITIGEDIYYPGAYKKPPTGVSVDATTDSPVGQGTSI